MRKILALSLFSVTAFTLDENPWLGNAYEWNFAVDQSYSRYRWVNEAKVQPSYAYNNYVTDLNLSFTLEDLALGVECEMARTPDQTYGFRSGALGAQYRLWNDIAGDLVSVTAEASMRGVTGRAVRDVSSPYSSYLNSELGVSIGKEFIKSDDWLLRAYVSGLIGLANHGSCWNRFSTVFEARFADNHVGEIFSLGYFGYGPRTEVDINHFHGWGEISHGSFDVGASYRYKIGLWGEIGLSYSYRPLAYSYPQNVQTASLFYRLPFSPF